jgi:hypothetical protein
MGSHATDSTEEDLGGSPVVERTGFFGVHDMTLVKEVVVAELGQYWDRFGGNNELLSHLVSEERARDVDLLAPDNNDFLAIENLLGDDGRQTTEEMAFPVDDNRSRGDCSHN